MSTEVVRQKGCAKVAHGSGSPPSQGTIMVETTASATAVAGWLAGERSDRAESS